MVKSKLFNLTATAMMVALVVALALTGLGYIPVGLFTLTILTLPVAVASVTLGPTSGAILGLAFGLTSFYTCFTTDMLGIRLVEENVVLTGIMCIVPRVLCGLLPGLLYRWLRHLDEEQVEVRLLLTVITLGIYGIYWQYRLVKKTKALGKKESKCVLEMLCLLFVPFYAPYWWLTRGNTVKNEFSARGLFAHSHGILYLILNLLGLNIVSMAIMQHDFNSLPAQEWESEQYFGKEVGAPAVCCAATAVCNTVFFLSTMWLFFSHILVSESGVPSIWMLFVAFAGVNALVEIATNFFLGGAISKALLVLRRRMHV